VSSAGPSGGLSPVAHGIKLSLRDYQDDGLNDIRAEMRAGKKAVLFVLPTGGGKTVTYAAMSQGAALRGNRILILEHRKELIRQASLAVGGLGVHHQVIAPPSKVAKIRAAHVQKLGWPTIDKHSHVAVASVQTLARRMDWLKEFDPTIIVIDEAHHAVAGTWARIIAACPDAVLVGVTATPVRADGQGLGKESGGCFDAMVLGPSMRELIQMGYLVPPKVYAWPGPVNRDEIGHKGQDIDTAAAAAILDKPGIIGDAVEHYRQLADGKSAIVFCASVRHAEHVAQKFRDAGYRFEVVHGDMEDEDRDERIAGLGDGRIQGIVTVDVVSEGTDIPCAEVAILLRPTESESLFLQQVGRVLRTVYAPGYDLSTEEGRHDAIFASGKHFGLILDHVGNVAFHGMPAMDREWTLTGRKKGPRNALLKEKPVLVMQCPKCHYTETPRAVCGGPKRDGTTCDHVFEVKSRMIEEHAGKLAEIQDGDLPPPRVSTGVIRTLEQAKAAGMSVAQFNHIEKARAEKDALINDLHAMLTWWARSTGRGVRDAWGFAIADIRGMKPKKLKEMIEKIDTANRLVELLNGRTVKGVSDQPMADMTVEQINELIDRAGEALFMGHANDNQNQQADFKLA
jgi:superfamily II DNA or RNA helicase